MKKITLSQEDKLKMMDDVVTNFAKALEDYDFTLANAKFSYEQSFSAKAKDKIIIRFTPQAYLRCVQMVNKFSSEIGWYGLIQKIDNRTYRVYDILVCKQKVSGARVITDDDDMIDFYQNLTDEQAEFLHFQAHSHVHMGTTPSTVDTENQMSTVRNLHGSGFYLFQIWNKRFEINSFLYDLDNNVFYDKDDIELIVEDSEFDTLSKFIEDAQTKVSSITYAQTQPAKAAQKKEEADEKTSQQHDEFEKYIEKPPYSPAPAVKSAYDIAHYWNDGLGNEGFEE